MKQTAVEWLYERLERMIPRTALYNIDKKEYFEQAKEMEKQQIINACNQTEFEDIDGMGIHETITRGEQYYKKNLKIKR